MNTKDLSNPCTNCLTCIFFLYKDKTNIVSLQPFFLLEYSNPMSAGTGAAGLWRLTPTGRLSPDSCLSSCLESWARCLLSLTPCSCSHFPILQNCQSLAVLFWCGSTLVLEQVTPEGREQLLKVLKKKI